jgi:hypothetical protein
LGSESAATLQYLEVLFVFFIHNSNYLIPVKNKLIIIIFSIAVCASCSKKEAKIESQLVSGNAASQNLINNYVKYTILKGMQYCDKSSYLPVDCSQLTFKVKFDSSSIYKTLDKNNQTDINKLFGFSDNNAAHHEFSARFGWRWSNDALRIFGYVYNNSVMSFKEIGTVKIGDENVCSIKISGTKYIFTLNDRQIEMPRASVTPLAEGYKLWPYFGGNEMAPHDISIWIMEMK